MNPRHSINRWAARLPEPADVASLSLASGLPTETVARVLAKDPDERPERDSPPEDVARPARDVVRQTLDWAEETLRRAEDAEVMPESLRLYALRCLAGLARTGGLITQATRLPAELEVPWTQHVLNDAPLTSGQEQRIEEAHREAAGWKTKALERTRRLQAAWHSHSTPPDALSLLRAFPQSATYADSLEPATGGDAKRSSAIAQRLGPQGQMLAASKTRMPWSDRIVFNARVRLQASGEDLWTGDFWLFPDDGPQTVDPRPGIRDIARHWGTVVVCAESGREYWRMRADGSLEVPEELEEPLKKLALRLDAAGWPPYLEWPRYPVD